MTPYWIEEHGQYRCPIEFGLVVLVRTTVERRWELLLSIKEKPLHLTQQTREMLALALAGVGLPDHIREGLN